MVTKNLKYAAFALVFLIGSAPLLGQVARSARTSGAVSSSQANEAKALASGVINKVQQFASQYKVPATVAVAIVLSALAWYLLTQGKQATGYLPVGATQPSTPSWVKLGSATEIARAGFPEAQQP